MTELKVEEKTAKLFYNRSNQSVRFPKGFELDAEDVIIQKLDNKLVIYPKPKSWDDYFESGKCLSSEFPDDIADLPLQARDEF